MQQIKHQTLPFILVSFLFISFSFLSFSSCKNETIEPQNPTDFPIDTTIKLINTLPNTIKESSGMVCFNNSIWTHNDSGDDPAIYQLDFDNQSLTKRIILAGGQNTDWEELTHDEEYLYIGDFGNNVGNRQDLIIYFLGPDALCADRMDETRQVFGFIACRNDDADLAWIHIGWFPGHGCAESGAQPPAQRPQHQ